MIILLQFNNATEITFEELKQKTGLPEADLDREIKKFMRIALAGAKPKLEDPKQPITLSHIIKINPNFQNKMRRINLNIRKS